MATTPILLPPSPTGINPSQSQQKKLHVAAQQFEALLIGEMLKSARNENSDGWLGGGETTGDDSAMDMAESQLSSALATRGGLGLAAVIERSMSARLSAQNENASAGVSSSSGKQ